MYFEKINSEKNEFWKNKFWKYEFWKNSSILLVLLLNFFMKVQTNKTPLNIYKNFI